MNCIELRGIVRAFDRGEPVLKGIDLDVADGEIVCLVGPNGAGKTTLLRVALGLLEAHRGTVRVFGQDPRVNPVEVKRRVGYVSDAQSLPGFISVADILEIHRGLFPTWDRDLERTLVAKFQLPPGATIGSLSKGQARQVAVLCAVAHRPRLLLLDEPGSGLDPAARRDFLEIALQLLTASGSAIVFSSHHMGDVERLAERVVVMRQGVKIVDAPLTDLREAHSLVVAAGSMETSEVLRSAAGCLAVRPEVDGTVRAVFAGAPDAVGRRLEAALPGGLVRCTTAPLEELFVEIARGAS